MISLPLHCSIREITLMLSMILNFTHFWKVKNTILLHLIYFICAIGNCLLFGGFVIVVVLDILSLSSDSEHPWKLVSEM